MESSRKRKKEEEVPMPAYSANACLLLLISLAGGAVLVWWAMEFHRHNEQLWMVPLGLVMVGTPVVVWFVVSASDACHKVELQLLADNNGGSRSREEHPSPPPPPPDLEK
ncbi:uncharacterized protein M6B38_309410 [Iris pallida]|uniref:Transmembrane protein n=1 Tax=Iris pallida TaxID=29817 RepID=A0AAX6HI74_IRIPA|nr:uncharacterized protein M6B38_315995 [Iris pallida]KAJ6840398.1 uncharacterized protein M6B38_309410 [Iris pallida]